MKEAIKSIGIFVVALFISVILYPFLHELGHLIMAILLGVRVVEVNLLPIPNIICETAASNIENFLIGFGGIFFPIILSICISTKKFWIWYANFILKGICLLSVVISALSLIFEKSQLFIQDDMRVVLSLWASGKQFCLIIIAFIAIILSLDLYKEYLWFVKGDKKY